MSRRIEWLLLPLVIALLLATVFFVFPAESVERRLCQPVPAGACPGTIAADGCCEVDGVPIQFVYHDAKGTNECSGATEFSPDLTRPIGGDRCLNFSSENCTYLYNRIEVDNYLTDACKNKDGIFMPAGMRAEVLWFKDSFVGNTWKCAGGGWSGPNGIGCSSGESSSSHTDGIQMRGLPMKGGQVLYQDSVIANGHNLNYLHQTQSPDGPGKLVLQGSHFGRVKAIGEATDYPADCRARGVDSTEICDGGRMQVDTDLAEVWIIDSTFTAPFSLKGNMGKVIVVGSCPGALDAIGGSGATGAKCYASLEAARSAGHTLPFGVAYSDAGWASAPDGSDPTPVPDPDPTPDPEPDPEPGALPDYALAIGQSCGDAIPLDGAQVEGSAPVIVCPETGIASVAFADRVEASPPYAMCGDAGEGAVNACPLEPGQVVSATVTHSDGRTVEITATLAGEVEPLFCRGDYNGDGTVSGADVVAFARQFVEGCPQP